MTDSFHSGFVSLIGRPNVGKSTLLNVVLGQKIAIVTEKPQTTRNRILGIKTYPDAQIIFIDTPGIHDPKNMLGKTMVRAAMEALKEIDLVVFVTEPGKFIKHDRDIVKSLLNMYKPVILLINKIDTVKKTELLAMIDNYREIYPFREIIPVSAIREDGIEFFLKNILKYLPAGPKYYPDEIVTDQIERLMVAEIIREKIMDRTSDEIPYSVAVEITDWIERENSVISINANIYVERQGQKGIIIGENGKMLKLIGTLARVEIEKLLNTRVFLQLWVKVKKGWRNNIKTLNELGYR